MKNDEATKVQVDGAGQQYGLGDYLVMTAGGALRYGRVTKFTPQGVTISYVRFRYEWIPDESEPGKRRWGQTDEWYIAKSNTPTTQKTLRIHELSLPQKIFEILDALPILEK